MALFGIPPLGCSPGVVANVNTNGAPCADIVNNAIQLFNSKLIPLVDQLNTDLHDAHFIFLNSYNITLTPTTGMLGHIIYF